MEESGVKADSALGVLYADSLEKQHKRRAQAKETAALVRKDVVAQANRVIANQKQPNERLEDMATIVVEGELPPRTGEHTDAERSRQVRFLTNKLAAEEKSLVENEKKRKAEEEKARQEDIAVSATTAVLAQQAATQ